MRPFRFGVVAATAQSGADWLAKARRIEALGYSTLLIPDGLRFTLSPFVALASAAAATTTLRLGTYVLANDFRPPTMLAKEAATLDFISGGRFELGLGAGRPAAEADNRALGLPFGSGGERLARLAESIALLKRLLSGESVTTSGQHYAFDNAQVAPGAGRMPPLLIAGAGPRMLELAAREADIIALGFGPTEPESIAADRIDALRAAAGPRFADLELNINLMAVGDQVPSYVAHQLKLSAADLAQANSIAAAPGSVDDICALLQSRRDRLGISYIVIADELMDRFAPIVERLSGK